MLKDRAVRKGWGLAIYVALVVPLVVAAQAVSDSETAAAAADTMLGGSVWEVFQRGGAVMYVILLASVVGLAVALEMAVRTRRGAMLPSATEAALAAHERTDDLVAAKPDIPLHQILHAGHTWRGGTHEQISAAIEESADTALWKLRRGARPIGIIANVAPLLGLLGTVVGIIQAFDVVATQGSLGDPAALAGGISKALLTTCFGLIVAIPMLLAYHYFTGRVEALIHHAEELAKEAYILPPPVAPKEASPPVAPKETPTSTDATPDE